MRTRRASGKILASIVLLIVGAVIGVIIFSWEYVVAPVEGPSYHLRLDSVYQTEPISMGNARWRIELRISNIGKDEVLLINLYVSRKPLDDYGLSLGDSLSSTSSTGTSVKREGLTIKPNTSEVVTIWIGSALFSSGNTISVHILNPDILEYTKYIKLK